MKHVNNIYLNLIELLKGKIKITEGELLHIKRSIKYIVKKEEIKFLENKTEFIKNCNQIICGLEGLKDKLKQAKGDLDEIGKQLKNSSNDHLKNNNYHLEIILQLDCIQSRTLAFAEKLEYLNRAYENLIGPYNAQYLPMPSVSKRIKTSSLMLYFNKNLNKIAQNLQKDFFKIEVNDTEKQEEKNIAHRVFTTWEFSSYEHLKSIDDEKQTFAALSFWFYEKQILYPIAFHEITHSIYMRQKFHDKTRDIKLSEEEKKEIVSKLLVLTDKDMTTSMVYTIYQDIVADFCAYSVAGASYIFSLFFTGFMRNLHLNFYKDLNIKSQQEQKNIDNESKQCLKRHDELTLLNWDFNSNNADNNLLSIYVRIMILVKLYIKQNNDIKDYLFKDELVAVVNILNFIYPNNFYFHKYVEFNNLKDISTFDDIMRIHEGRYNQYNFVKNFTHLFLNLMDDVVFKNKKLDERVKNYIKNHSEDFKNNSVFKSIITSNEETKELENDYDSFVSEFDLFWKKKFKDINFDNTSNEEDKKTYLGRLLRLYNLSKILDDKLDINLKLNDIIYEFVFLKFQTEEQIFLDFVDNGDVIQEIQNIFDNESRISYAFGPFDISILTKNTSKDVDKYLYNLSVEKIDFFTERHALLLLKDIDGKYKAKDNYFDVSISIDIQGEFQEEDTNEGCKEETKSPRCKFEKLKNLLEGINRIKFSKTEKNLNLMIYNYHFKIIYFNNIKIFASLGNENYIVYIEGTNKKSFNIIMDKLLELKVIKNINTTILLNNIDKKKLGSLKIENREVVLLCKLNKKNKTYNESIENINSKLKVLDENIRVFKKYGIFDIAIIPKNNTYFDIYNIVKELKEYLSDVQMELQLKL